MGNCIRRHEESSSSSSMKWGGEDWGSLMANEDLQMKKKKTEEGDVKAAAVGVGSYNNSTEVKIKMTKKQLEELLGRSMELKQMTVHQIIAQLISLSTTTTTTDQRSNWRPALQTIPELN